MVADLRERPGSGVKILLADLKECSRAQQLEKGAQVHAEAVKCGHDSNIRVASALVNMYAKCGSMVHARQVFDSLENPNVVAWTALILGYAENGQGLTALELFQCMRNRGLVPNSVTVVAAFKACSSLALKGQASECRERGKEVHAYAVEIGCDSEMYVQNTLIDMFAKCGSLEDAHQVFSSVQHPDVVSWNVLILGYAENGRGLGAFNMLKRMKCGGIVPDRVTFMGVLKACTPLALKGGNEECRQRGKQISNLTVENGCNSDICVQSTLIDMYAGCGGMVEARQVFDHMEHLSVVPWTALILGYANNGQAFIALDLLRRMRRDGPALNSVTLVAALKACSSLTAKQGVRGLAECRGIGRAIHILAVENGCDSDSHVRTSLIDMYANCDSMVDARRVFESMHHPNVASWTALILGYAENGQGLVSLDLFMRMESVGPAPNSLTFLAALKACSFVGALEVGRRIHLEVEKQEYRDLVLVNCLVDFYAKCGSLVEAKGVFDQHSETRNLVTWTSLLAGFSSCGHPDTVFELFEGMQDAGLSPDAITFVGILLCCSHAGLVEKGKECFDAMSARYGVTPTIEHYTCMVDVFGRANKLDDAVAVLECMPSTSDTVIWRTILCACRKWKNAELGRLAFQSLISLDDKNTSAYMLMAQVYGSQGMLQEQEMVMRMKKKVVHKAGETCCWTNGAGEVHAFVFGKAVLRTVEHLSNRNTHGLIVPNIESKHELRMNAKAAAAVG